MQNTEQRCRSGHVLLWQPFCLKLKYQRAFSLTVYISHNSKLLCFLNCVSVYLMSYYAQEEKKSFSLHSSAIFFACSFHCFQTLKRFYLVFITRSALFHKDIRCLFRLVKRMVLPSIACSNTHHT